MFFVYLVQQRGMSMLEADLVASLPALCGLVGGDLGGWLSDRLARGGTLHQHEPRRPSGLPAQKSPHEQASRKGRSYLAWVDHRSSGSQDEPCADFL
ncbi:hypothetical protein [Streptomyces olivaceoviridis]|uniref:hypothetical protein n=1 Tax=Streptomyces olivaceoviridis TaxID=1921 RepID=UPI0036C4AB45